ncbi:uncharacterized protein NPIL_307581 [Nephila pilipes]|uniref:Uncharacterized protein n=1 Tax=Nephila pilipes TaxID=299642 RepID=A0A8X6PN35_NEPPI|nr:uncharacterized protein NPIL_307581 [Nephila pilipes]
MNKSANLLEKVFMPILLLFHLTGMETMPEPHSFNGNKLFRFVWNFPNYAFKGILFLVVVTQIMWLIFVSSTQSDCALFIIIILQVSAYISLLRSREKIRLLLSKLSKISRILLSSRRWRFLRISVLAYCIIMFSLHINHQMTYFLTKFREYTHYAIYSSASVPEELKVPFSFIIGIFWESTTAAMFCIGGSFIGYYCFVCICIKSCITKFVLKTEILISQGDYHSILSIHEELSQVMGLANEFLSFSAFINVLSSMSGLFAFSYSVVFYPSDDRTVYFMMFQGIIQSLMSLILLMIPAAGCNRALILAQETINSLPGWLPQHRKLLKMCISQRHSKTFPLTLWNIYVIDESLLISAFGTLLTYGFLVGNINIAKK